jgi:RNA polymerase sigma-70 factor (ECF subfamily)
LENQRQLIQQCIADDRQGQEKLYRAVYPALILLCRGFFADEHTALQVVNDGMLKVYRNIGKFDEGKGDFFNWIYTIVRNTALDRLRVNKLPALSVIDEDTDVAVFENPLQKMERMELYRMLDLLSPATRVICNLFYLEGFSIREIAASLEISAGTVKWHLSETRKKLRPAFENYYHD